MFVASLSFHVVVLVYVFHHQVQHLLVSGVWSTESLRVHLDSALWTLLVPLDQFTDALGAEFVETGADTDGVLKQVETD